MSLDVVALTQELIRIDSSNPSLVPGAPGESVIADFLEHWSKQHGFEVTRLEETPGRPSVVAIHRGSGGGQSVMLNGHIDTVSLGSYHGNALDPEIRDGNIYGRGSYDMKSGVAAMLVAAATVAATPHRGDIILALVADEEFASAGTEEVLRHFSADYGIVCEPSGMDVVTAHRGFAWFDVKIHGRAAHGSRRELGIDAIVKAGAFLTALGQHDFELSQRTPHPLLNTANIHASLISGGEELSSYPAECIISLERRTLPGESSASVESELREILDLLSANDSDFTYEINPGLHRNPFSVDTHNTVVQSVVSAYTDLTGTNPTLRGEPFWTDCALLSDAGIPCVLFGVDGGGAHAAEEWTSIESLHTVTQTLTSALRSLTL